MIRKAIIFTALLLPAALGSGGCTAEPAPAREPKLAGGGAEKAPECGENAPSLPAEYAAWPAAMALSAATAPDGAGKAVIPLGAARDLALATDGDVSFAPPPGRDAKPGAFGGIARFAVKEAGVYRVALGKAAWVDVVGGGKAIESIAHAHGPDCSGIRKIVDFRLEAWDYALQLSGSPEATLRVLVIPLPAG